MKTSILTGILGATLVLGGGARSLAGDAAGVAVSGGDLISFSDPSGTVIGWEFTVDLPVCVAGLGYYDSGLDDLSDTHDVGLFTAAGGLITSATVSPGDPLENGFRYVSIPAFCTTVGETYIVAAYTLPGSSDLIARDPSIAVHPAITFVGGRIANDVPFGFPSGASPSTYFGPNVKLNDDCLSGTVNDLTGPISDVLFLNGTGGADSLRTVNVAEGDLIWGAILTPPAGSNGKYVLHADTGAPSAATVTPLPAGVGDSCFPFLLAGGASPVAVWNNIGKTDLVGSSMYFDGSSIPDPPKAPAIFLQLSQGDAVNLPTGTTVTFQGIVVDFGSTSGKSASTTNAVILNVL